MTPAGRRPSATRDVFAIEEPELLLPDPIALDTSFVVEALIATHRRASRGRTTSGLRTTVCGLVFVLLN